MPIFTVRISGTAPVWADVEVEAPTAKEAYAMVNNGDVPNLEELTSDAHEWEFCEGGNGIDDWTTTGDVYDAEGNELMTDGEWQEEEHPDTFKTASGSTLHWSNENLSWYIGKSWEERDVAFPANGDGLPVDHLGEPLEGAYIEEE